jgi:hypothetical protein
MEIGTSVTSIIARTAPLSMPGSSAPGIPAFTSSMVAPASTCARASLLTRVKSKRRSSSASFLRFVGLIRSPMTTNGLSGLMTTVLVADETIVFMRGAPAGGR